MSKSVHKHCNILNYIKQADKELYELVQELCIGRMFNPRRGSPGLTFLRPDDSLMKEIKSLAYGDNPEKAVEILQSCVLLDYLPKPDDFDAKKDDIPTFLRKKLQVVSADGKKVVLKGNGEITVDKAFESRADRSNLAVYILSKALVEPGVDASTFSNAKLAPKKVKGGAEMAGCNRVSLYNKVLDECADAEKSKDRDPAMEVLISIMQFLTSKKFGNPAHAHSVRSQLSHDTLASLTIVLQPYLGSHENGYLTDSMFEEWTKNYSHPKLGYYIGKNVKPGSLYVDYMNTAASDAIVGKIVALRDEVRQYGSKPTALKMTSEAHSKLVGLAGDGPRGSARRDQNMSESELRVLFAIEREHLTSGTTEEYIQRLKAIAEVCKLDAPYLCHPDQVKDMSIAHYLSTVGLVTRSDAFFYWPGVAKSSDVLLSNINDFDNAVNLYGTRDYSVYDDNSDWGKIQDDASE
jgi:hypothetical protein